jgi:hypothetical protein
MLLKYSFTCFLECIFLNFPLSIYVPESVSAYHRLFVQATTSGLDITAGQRTLSGQNRGLTGQRISLPVILTGHFF